MVGSYGPKADPQEYLTPCDEAPKGMLARGHYTSKSKFIDDDKNCYLEWEWGFDIKKDWEWQLFDTCQDVEISFFFFFYVGRQSIFGNFFFLKFEFDATLYALFLSSGNFFWLAVIIKRRNNYKRNVRICIKMLS